MTFVPYGLVSGRSSFVTSPPFTSGGGPITLTPTRSHCPLERWSEGCAPIAPRLQGYDVRLLSRWSACATM